MTRILFLWNLSGCKQEAVWSGSSLFPIPTSILGLPALMTHILVENLKRKLFEIFEHLSIIIPNNASYVIKVIFFFLQQQYNRSKTDTLKKTTSWFQDQLSLNAGQKYCRMLQGEHSAILSTFIKLQLMLSLRCLFCLLLSGRFTQVLLNLMSFKEG